MVYPSLSPKIKTERKKKAFQITIVVV